jgi:hypothetical protein
MQADWATVGRGLSVFIATLGWSRMTYVEFCDDERVETLIRCHENAFVAFGGGTREVLFDNLWTASRRKVAVFSRWVSNAPCGRDDDRCCLVPAMLALRSGQWTAAY